MADGKRGRPKGLPKTGGRKAGTKNRVTVEAREAAEALVDAPEYRARLAARLNTGKIAPAVEVMLWHYAKGKPVERHEIGAPGAFESLSDAELKAKLADVLARL